MTTKISELPSTVLPSGTHEVAAMKDDLTVKLTVDQIINLAAAQILDSAPGSLDTLNELAAALGDDPSFATTVTASLSQKLGLTGGTLTGNLQIPTLNPGDASQHAVNAAFVQQEKIIKKIHIGLESTDYTRVGSLNVAGSLSDAFSFTPVSTTSSFLIFTASNINTKTNAGGNDARASISLRYHNDTAYVALHTSLTGLVNVTPVGSGDAIIHYDSVFNRYNGSQSIVRSVGNVTLRIYGENDYSNMELQNDGTLFVIMEYENVS